MGIPFKVLTLLALAAAALFPPAAFGVSAGDYFAEAGVGALCECAVIGAGAAVYAGGVHKSEINANVFFGAIIIGTYPIAAATGVYFMGEALDGPSANKTRAWGFTTVASYGVTAVLWVGSAALGGGYIGPAVDVALAKPFLTPLIYHAVKDPVAPTGESRRATFEPYVATATGSDGKAVPVYGVTLYF